MRKQRVFVLGCLLLVIPSIATAQAYVVAPGAGEASSYRKTVLRWLPTPGVTSYRLEVDDDPAFRSPEVDVVVDRPFYALNGETLRLNGQLSWAAYVRINGVRWERSVFSPSYVRGGTWPDIAVDSGGKIYYGYLGGRFGKEHAFVRTSDDFADAVRLSPPDTDGNPHGIALGIDPSGMAHAFWTEQRLGQSSMPFHASSPDWTPVPLGERVFGLLDVRPSIVFTGGRIEVFDEVLFGPVARFTSSDGRTFTRSTVPNSSDSLSVHATLDPSGNIVLVEERLAPKVVLQRSDTNWSPELIADGRFPTVAVGADGVVHILKRENFSGEVSYSNSGRGFTTWTPLPVPPVPTQEPLPIVVDDQRQQLYMASPASDGTRLCASTIAGDAWSCRRIGGAEGRRPALTLDSSGVLHIGWADAHGGGYASSLGSFVAVNLPARARFAPPVAWPNTVIVDTAVSDGDGDAVHGSVAVGTSKHDRTVLRSDESLLILGDSVVSSGTALVATSETLLFRVPGGEWRTAVARADLAFPAEIAVSTRDRRLVDAFTIEAWSELAVTIDRLVFTPHVRKLFDGTELPSIDLQSVPAGALTLRVSVSDGASWRVFDAPVVRVPGQSMLTLVDFMPAADALGAVLATIPPSHLTAPGLASVLRFWLDAALVTAERALVTLDLPARTLLVDRAHDTLRDRVVQRGDGCGVTGGPDGDDWILDCADQSRLSAAGGRLLRAIDALR